MVIFNEWWKKKEEENCPWNFQVVISSKRPFGAASSLEQNNWRKILRNQQQLYCFLTEVFGDEIWQLSLKYLNFMIGYRPKVKFLFKSQKCHHWKSILKWTHKFQYNQRYTSWYKMTYLWFSSHEPNVTMILFPLFNHQWSSLKVKKAYTPS